MPARPKKRARPVYRKLFSPWSVAVACVVLVGSFLLPERGLGVPLCWFKGLTGVPCPGCGLSRSVTHIAHLHFGEALVDHPFGFPIYALAIALVIGLAVPRARRSMVRWLVRHEAASRRAYWAFVACFLVFGVGRIGLALVAPEVVAHL